MSQGKREGEGAHEWALLTFPGWIVILSVSSRRLLKRRLGGNTPQVEKIKKRRHRRDKTAATCSGCEESKPQGGAGGRRREVGGSQAGI